MYLVCHNPEEHNQNFRSRVDVKFYGMFNKYTGRFITCSGFTKICDNENRRTRIYETCTDKRKNSKYFPQKIIFHRSSHFCR
jgi:hypothetical protein